MKLVPTASKIEQLHRKYTPTTAIFELVYGHCTVVRDVAKQLINTGNFIVNKELVLAGCMIHDIGVYDLFDSNGLPKEEHYITHGIKGEKILANEGFADTFCRFASHHTGVGLTKEAIQAQKFPLPAQDYLADTAEERLIMYADKFHSKSNPPSFNSYEYYKKYTAEFSEGNAIIFEALAEEFGVPDILGLAAKYQQSINA